MIFVNTYNCNYNTNFVEVTMQSNQMYLIVPNVFEMLLPHQTRNNHTITIWTDWI